MCYNNEDLKYKITRESEDVGLETQKGLEILIDSKLKNIQHCERMVTRQTYYMVSSW